MLQKIIAKLTRKQNVFKFHYTGEFSSWEEVMNEAKGYDADEIFSKTCEAALNVKNGKAAFERDSVLFPHFIYSWPIVSILQHTAIKKNGILNVLDFGGSLGSSFFQHQFFLKEINSLQWKIVELPNIVEFGKINFENNILSFHHTIDEAEQKNKTDILFSSGTFQYLPQPFIFIEDICNKNFPFLLFDRIALVQHEKEILTLQKIEKDIYEASYPAWFFNEVDFIKKIEEKGYVLQSSFDSYCDKAMLTLEKKQVYWKGFYFTKTDE